MLSYALLGKTGYINRFVIFPGLLSQYGPRGVHFGSKKCCSVSEKRYKLNNN